MQIRAWASSDIGNVKKLNEDSFYLDQEHRVFVVADGVSGRKAGDVASQKVVAHFQDCAAEINQKVQEGNAIEDDGHRENILQALTKTVQDANTLVYDMGKQPEYHGGMATTIVSLALSQYAGFVAHVGDSRVYLIRSGKIFRITEDHTYAEELRRYAGNDELPNGINERFSHVLTRSIGGRPRVDVDVVFFELQPGDAFLLCTDGLTDYLSGSEILEMTQKHDSSDVADALTMEAKKRGGRDNITSLYVEIGEPRPEIKHHTTRVDTLQRITLLSQMHLFKDLTRLELLRMLRVVYDQSFAKGETIVKQGEKSSAIYLIVEGAVVITRENKHLTTLREGSHFGELSMFEASSSSVTAQSTSDETLVLAIPIPRFIDLIQEDLKLGHKLLWNALSHLAQHVEHMNEQMVDDDFAKTLELRSISRDHLKKLTQSED